MSARKTTCRRHLLRRAACGSGGESSSVRAPGYRARRGFTLIELIVTIGILGVVLSIAVPRLLTQRFGIHSARAQLIADFRLTRSDALARGDHFQLRVTSITTYVEERMQLVGVVWQPLTPATRRRTLPDGILFTGNVGSTFEFNTRGLLVTPGAAATLTLRDTKGITRPVTVWPSGQVAAL